MTVLYKYTLYNLIYVSVSLNIGTLLIGLAISNYSWFHILAMILIFNFKKRNCVLVFEVCNWRIGHIKWKYKRKSQWPPIKGFKKKITVKSLIPLASAIVFSQSINKWNCLKNLKCGTFELSKEHEKKELFHMVITLFWYCNYSPTFTLRCHWENCSPSPS